MDQLRSFLCPDAVKKGSSDQNVPRNKVLFDSVRLPRSDCRRHSGQEVMCYYQSLSNKPFWIMLHRMVHRIYVWMLPLARFSCSNPVSSVITFLVREEYACPSTIFCCKLLSTAKQFVDRPGWEGGAVKTHRTIKQTSQSHSFCRAHTQQK